MILRFETVSLLLKETLERLMTCKELNRFLLVGGTSLSLQLGHRISTDIDLFTDAEYGSIDFNAIEAMLQREFPYVDDGSINLVALGKHYFVGLSEREAVKLDIYYTDTFVFEKISFGSIRLADMREIAAMKLEAICGGGRKKDYWDLHELMNHFSISDMISFHEKRYPFGHDKKKLLDALQNFSFVDDDLDPICLKSKYWELIKLDIQAAIESV